MTAFDLASARGALDFCERRRGEMVRCFERLGRFEADGSSFAAVAFMTHEVRGPNDPRSDRLRREWSTGKAYPEVTAVQFTMPRELATVLPDRLQTAVFANGLRAFCKFGRAVGVVVMAEQWWGTTPSLDERRAGGPSWRAEIHRDPPRLGPWLDPGSGVGGVLIDILPREVWAS